MTDEKKNSGDGNSGNRNSGDMNSGNWNSGDGNSGEGNSGDWNSGEGNSGNWNSGDMNSGNGNSGNWNSGDGNAGYFCVNSRPLLFFDVVWDGTREQADELIPYIDLPCGVKWISESEMTDEEKTEHPKHKTLGGYLKSKPIPITESFPIVWESMTDADKQPWLDLPNFDADKFLIITGVDVRKKPDNKDENDKPQNERVRILGKLYELVPVKE